MDKTKTSARKKNAAAADRNKKKMPNPNPPIPAPLPFKTRDREYSYYSSNSTYMDDKGKVEKHLEVRSEGDDRVGHYVETKNGEVKVHLTDMKKIEKYLDKSKK